MPCIEVVQVVTDYLEGALPGRVARRFERHLAGCPHCTEYVREMRVVIAAAGAIELPALSADTEAEILAAFTAAIDERRG